MNRKQNSLMRFSRTERLAQLSEQEIVIERKKREIQAKIEAQKKKETEEALKKLESPKTTKNIKNDFNKKSWNRNPKKLDKDGKSDEYDKKEIVTNAFSNDGSFLDQFKKLSQTGYNCNNINKQTLELVKNNEEGKLENDEKEFDRRDQDTKNEFRKRSFEKDENPLSLDRSNSSSIRKPLDSNIQLQLPPPGVVQLIPQHSVQMATAVPPPVQNSVTIVPPPSVQITNLQPTCINPQFNTNEIQLKPISSSFNYCDTPQSDPLVGNSDSEPLPDDLDNNQLKTPQQVHSQTYLSPPLTSFHTSLPVTLQNIPPPSSTQDKNTLLSYNVKENIQFPKTQTDTISFTLKNISAKKGEPIFSPLDSNESPISPVKNNTSLNFLKKEKDNSCFETAILSENGGTHNEELCRISSAFSDDERQDCDDFIEEHRRIAQMVAQNGDDFEDSLYRSNQSNPTFRFLLEKNSKTYTTYRKLVQMYRKNLMSVEGEKPDDKTNFTTDVKKFETETKSYEQELNDDSCSKDSMERDKNSREAFTDTEFRAAEKYDGYQADNEDNLPYYKMPDSTSKEECFTFSQKRKIQPETENESPKVELKRENCEELFADIKADERRKRKRKSRWGDAVAGSSTYSSPGVNLNLQPSGKLPAPKTTLLSKLTRSDPGLIQYAKQTFGSTNLSEEDWKKAEDHYKINLLYQDMVKKRAEIDKLERAGKFKYEYDSDEDVEGGTWEHKLRQQEMMATQLWAEELTRQAAGKHHIGDFLPPEELERFMEKYNAVKEGREPDLSDYKEFKLKQDNVGYRLLQKMGWNEGQGLGQDGSGITKPVNKAVTRHENQGLGVERPDGLEPGDDEYDAYRKRMMLAYRFRPNPLNNPRRPYY